MKKLILTCTLISSVSLVAMAQATQNGGAALSAAPGTQQAQQGQVPPLPTAETMAENRAQNWDKLLTLTPAQHKAIYEAELTLSKMAFAMKAGTPRPAPAQMQQMFADKDGKFKAVLTPEQWTKYDATRPKMNAAAPAPTPAGR